MRMVCRISAFIFLGLIISQVSVAQCNAGNDAVVEICNDASPIDLFTKIQGFPNVGGYWLDPLDAPFVNPYDPAADLEGTYKYIVESDFNGAPCPVPDTAFIEVDILDLPAVSFTMDETSACGELAVNFVNTSNTMGFDFSQWDFGDGGTSFATDPLYTFQDTGCFDVSLTLSHASGCQVSDTLYDAACVLQEPSVFFSLEVDPIRTDVPVAKFISDTQGVIQFSWNVPGVGNFSGPEPVVDLPAIEDSYFVCLQGLSEDGCISSYCRTVRVREAVNIFVPSAITPDQDLINDNFRPVLSFDPQVYELLVFDKWGNEVFQSDDPLIGWNGADDQNEFFVSDGFYHWKLKVVKDGEVITRKGHVTVLR